MPEYKWQIFSVTGLANITTTIAMSSINLALPIIADEFLISMSAVSWLSIVYYLIPSCTLLIFGRAADIFGYKRQFIGGFLLFGLSALLLSLLARGMASLLIFRSFQALGYSMMISITQAMCNRTFPENERGRALGINAVFVSVGLAIGPSIGGFLIFRFGWRSIFLFNAPFCILGVLASLMILKKDIPQQGSAQRMDWLGSFFFAVFIGLSVFAINFSAEWGAASVRFVGCMIVSLSSLLLFIIRQSRTDVPLMNLGFFRNPTFSLSNGAIFCSYFIQQMNTFLMPFFLMNILLLASGRAGFVMLASPIAMMLLSPIGGRLTDSFGSRKPALTGLTVLATACVIMSTMSQATPVFVVILGLFLFGAGNGMSVVAINSAIFSAVPKTDSGIASGMVATMRNLGQTIGVACAGAIMALRRSHYTGRAPVGPESADGSIIYLMAQRDVYYFGVFIIAIAIICVFMIRSGKPGVRKKGDLQ